MILPENINMYIAGFLFLVSLVLYPNTAANSKTSKVAFFFLSLGSLFLYVVYYVSDFLTGSGVDESVIYHLRYGLKGAGFSDCLILIKNAIAIFGSCCGILLFVLFKKKKESPAPYRYFSFLFIVASILINPATYDLIRLNLKKSPNPFFSVYYRKPSIKKINDQQRNLILIYAESVERTYFNESIFPGLITQLRKLESKSIYFTNINQAWNTGWTVAGLVGSQCGIALATPSHGNSMSGMDSYLPSAVCLSDLLHNEGYEILYLGGANLDFAGKGKFLRSHHFDEVLGKRQLVGSLESKSYLSAWGLYDDTLFNIAYDRFAELSKEKKRFFLSVLTLDTHHPRGNPSKSCDGIIYREGANPILNAVACSDYLISDFIQKIMRSPFAENTVIVLVSDHLARRNTAYNLLRNKTRKNMFMIFDLKAKKPKRINRSGSTVDIGATILPFIGFEGSLGLGRNLLDAKEKDSDIEYIQKNLMRWDKELLRFWDFPKIHDFVKINILNKFLDIDGRRFGLPILVEFDNKFKTTLKFDYNLSSGQKTLIDHLKKIDKKKNFIFIDTCEKFHQIGRDLGKNDFCLMVGKEKKSFWETELSENMILTVDDLRKILQLNKAPSDETLPASQ